PFSNRRAGPSDSRPSWAVGFVRRATPDPRRTAQPLPPAVPPRGTGGGAAKRPGRDPGGAALAGFAALAGSPCPKSADLLVTTSELLGTRHDQRQGLSMIPLNLSGKLALVTGVGDDIGFAWYIAKALGAAGARLVFASHPRLVNVVENILERD